MSKEENVKKLKDNIDKLVKMAKDIFNLATRVMYSDDLFIRFKDWYELCGNGESITNGEFCKIHQEQLEEIILMDQLQKEMKQ